MLKSFINHIEFINKKQVFDTLIGTIYITIIWSQPKNRIFEMHKYQLSSFLYDKDYFFIITQISIS
jgi:hypothetical protein